MNKKNQYHVFRVCGFIFECDNYCNWKPGLQLTLDCPFSGVLDVNKTFTTPAAVEQYVRKMLLKMAKDIVKELESEHE